MKKLLILISLIHLPLLAMHRRFDLEEFLERHHWLERKNALTPAQRKEFAAYLIRIEPSCKNPIPNYQLAVVLMHGLHLVEQPEFTSKRALSRARRDWVYLRSELRAICPLSEFPVCLLTRREIQKRSQTQYSQRRIPLRFNDPFFK